MKNIKLYIALGVALLLVLVVVCNLHIIPTGYTGVKTTFGQIRTEPLPNGQLFITIPFVEKIENVNNKQQEYKVETKVWGETNDKTPVFAENISVTYNISPQKSAWIYANISDYTKNLLTQSLIASALKAAMVELGPDQVTNRAMIEPLAMRKLQESLDEKYDEGTIYIHKVIINNMDFEDVYNQAIQQKSLAIQEQKRIEIENQTAISKAEADKKVSILKAEAEAEKIRIAAEAEADANTLIQESLAPELIEIRKIEAWDGKLPVFTGSVTPFIDIEDFTERK